MSRISPILFRGAAGMAGLLILCTTGCGTTRSRIQSEKESGVHYKLGMAYLSEDPPKMQKAYVEFLQATEMDPKNAEAYYALGHIYAQRQEYNKAMEAFQKTLALDPTASKAHNYMGNLYEVLGQEDEAISAYRQALSDLQYETPQLPHWKLGLLYFKKGQYELALAEFREAQRIEPDNIVVIHQIGETYTVMGQDEKARAFFEEAVKVAPNDSRAHHGLAQFYFVKGLFEPAAEAFKKVIELSPESDEAKDAHRMLDRIEADRTLDPIKESL